MAEILTSIADIMKKINKDFKSEVCTFADKIVDYDPILFPSPAANYPLYKGIPRGRFTQVSGLEGSGKALSLDTPILTKEGFKVMGDIQVGDIVYDELGQECSVTFTTPVMNNHDVYNVIFSDGSIIKADAEHIWALEDLRGDCVEMTTEEILKTGGCVGIDLVYRFNVPKVTPLSFNNQELPIDPYLLGYWLGGGNPLNIQDHADSIKYSANDCLNLFGSKHIPDTYKKASVEHRLNLIAGIIDSSSCLEMGYCEITLLSNIIEDVRFILNSLGIITNIKKNPNQCEISDKVAVGEISIISFDSFPLKDYIKLPSKKAQFKSGRRDIYRKRYIIDIIKTESVPVKCIQVDSQNHIYLCGETLIPTHNTLLVSALIHEEQRLAKVVGSVVYGKKVVFIDIEHTYDKRWAQTNGVDLDELVYINPIGMSGETVLTIASQFLEAKDVSLVAIDSFAALMTQEEFDDKDIGATTFKSMAKPLGKFLRIAIEQIARNNITLIGINQLRMNVGDKYHPFLEPGGKALDFFSSVHLRCGTKKYINEDGEDLTGSPDDQKEAKTAAGIKVRFKVIKNKVTPNNRSTGFMTVRFRTGVDQIADTLDIAKLIGVVKQAGSIYQLVDPETGEVVSENGEPMKWKGMASLKKWFYENGDKFYKYQEAVNQRISTWDDFNGAPKLVEDKEGAFLDESKITTGNEELDPMDFS